MARIRTVKPEFWTDSTMVTLPFEARLLFVGLWNFADDEGCLWDEADRLKMQIFPGDTVDAEALLDLLVAAERVERYEGPDGRRFLEVRHFALHQRVDHPAKCLFPPREDSRKLSVPPAVRRAVARKYECAPGESKEVNCYYCGAPGRVWWPRLYDGRPGAWVSFSGLELDHVQSEADCGETEPANLVLACQPCKRSKHTRDGVAFLPATVGRARAREGSRGLARARSGMEGKGREGKGRGMEVEEDRAAAADAPPVVEKAAPKGERVSAKSQRIAKVADAFRAAGLKFPVLLPQDSKAVGLLVDAGWSAEQLAECWSDIKSGSYLPGDRFASSQLSFQFLSGYNRVGNWLDWLSLGRPSAKPVGGRGSGRGKPDFADRGKFEDTADQLDEARARFEASQERIRSQESAGGAASV